MHGKCVPTTLLATGCLGPGVWCRAALAQTLPVLQSFALIILLFLVRLFAGKSLRYVCVTLVSTPCPPQCVLQGGATACGIPVAPIAVVLKGPGSSSSRAHRGQGGAVSPNFSGRPDFAPSLLGLCSKWAMSNATFNPCRPT